MSHKTFYPLKSGSWYPSDPAQLASDMKDYFSGVKLPTDLAGKKPRVIMVPHPGFAYGGPTAAYAYRNAAFYNYRNVFIVFTSHLAHFSEIILGDFESYETPFGALSGNLDIVSYFQNQNTVFKVANDLVQNEHAIEMQLPFIKLCFPKAAVIPLGLSAIYPTNAHLLAQELYKAVTPDDLIIISTDFSHYPNYHVANQLDKSTLAVIKTGNPIALATHLDKPLPEGADTAACGAMGIFTGLYLAERLGLTDIEILHYENSGDRPIGDKQAVVGYGAVAIYTTQSERFDETVVLSESEQVLLKNIVRQTLDAAVHKKELPDFDNQIDAESPLNHPYGVFVTLKVNHQLRGCMGNFEPETPLYKVVQETTLLSAFEDPRFSPMTDLELPSVDFDISILSPRKKVDSYLDIIPGKHGVYIHQNFSGGTFLPQVAPEQGWDRAEMLSYLCSEKAGLPADAWKTGATISTYTALVI